ncbi:MAG: GPP34 family phosphoprotein, partial [Gammaproteobacteria bacterium]|nr:GPP34 family phosphoprotein [Gammaproteobacteria bacterium]
MRLTEELTLLMLDEESGYLEMVPGWDFACVMAGAVIAGLALEERIDTDLDTLRLIDATPTGDELLDPTLKEIAEAEEERSTQYWIERSAARSEDIVAATLERLVDKGILDHETGGFWTLSRAVSRSGKYPGAAGKGGEDQREVKSRILDSIWNDDIPDPRDAILVSLMHTCEGLKLL